MKLGLVTVPLYGMTTEEILKYVSGLGVEAVEIGVGGYPEEKHSNPRSFLLTSLS